LPGLFPYPRESNTGASHTEAPLAVGNHQFQKEELVKLQAALGTSKSSVVAWKVDVLQGLRQRHELLPGEDFRRQILLHGWQIGVQGTAQNASEAARVQSPARQRFR